MTEFELIRTYLDNCTIGKFYYMQGRNSIWLCYTVELPYHSNQRTISCIPPGRYKMIRHRSKKHNWPIAYRLTSPNLNVGPGKHRTGCLIHPANYPGELAGCIAPGLYLHPKRWGVVRSRKALKLIDKYYTQYNKVKSTPNSYLTIK